MGGLRPDRRIETSVQMGELAARDFEERLRRTQERDRNPNVKRNKSKEFSKYAAKVASRRFNGSTLEKEEVNNVHPDINLQREIISDSDYRVRFVEYLLAPRTSEDWKVLEGYTILDYIFTDNSGKEHRRAFNPRNIISQNVLDGIVKDNTFCLKLQTPVRINDYNNIYMQGNCVYLGQRSGPRYGKLVLICKWNQ